METIASTVCRRPPRTTIFASSTIMQPTWDTSTMQFTKQYHKWLEDIGRYGAENGINTITDHVKIPTLVNNLK
eukprot:407585-Amphidinium_carterae.1